MSRPPPPPPPPNTLFSIIYIVENNVCGVGEGREGIYISRALAPSTLDQPPHTQTTPRSSPRPRYEFFFLKICVLFNIF